MRSRVSWLVLAVLPALVVATASLNPPSVQAASFQCIGAPAGSPQFYPEPRIFLDGEAWWNPTPGLPGSQISHLHVATCFPLGATLNGIVHFDVRVTMFNTPGTLNSVEIGLVPGGCSGTKAQCGNGSQGVGLKCPAGQFCEAWRSFDLNTNLFDQVWQEFRFKPRLTETDGKQQIVSTRWHACFGCSHALNGVGSLGWYTGHGYQRAKLSHNSGMLYGCLSGTVPLQLELNPAADGKPGVLSALYLDPNFHAGQMGTILLQNGGNFVGTYNFNTTQHANGPHVLLLRHDGKGSGTGTNTGTLRLPINICN